MNSSLILLEIQSVLAGMKRNAKWKRLISANCNLNGLIFSPDSLNDPPDNLSREETIIFGFTRLKSLLEASTPLTQLKGIEIAHSFLLLITYPETTGPITGLALSSIERLLRFRVFGTFQTVGLFMILIRDVCLDGLNAIMAIVHSTTHCKFEATDSASDEVVLLRILQILELSMESKHSKFLSDEIVCGMLECAFSMCFQMRLSHCLRKSAEMTVVNILCKVIDFCQLTTASNSSLKGDSLSEVFIHNTSEIAVTPTIPIYKRRPSGDQPEEEEFVHVSPYQAYDGFQSENSFQIVPFGIPTVRELIRFTAALLDVSDQHNTESMRIIALNVFQVLLEYGSKLIISSSLLIETLPSSTRILLRGHLSLYSQSVQVSNILFSAFHSHLPSHYEFYISEILFSALWSDIFYIFQPNNEFVPMKMEKYEKYCKEILPGHFIDSSDTSLGLKELLSNLRPKKDRVLSVSSSVYEEVIQFLWESTYQQMRSPTFIENLFVQYDCNQYAKNLLHELLGLLCHTLLCKNLNQDVLIAYNRQENTGYYEEGVENNREFSFGLLASMDLISSILSGFLKRVSFYGYELSPTADEHSNGSGASDIISTLKHKQIKKSVLTKAALLFEESENSSFSFLNEQGIIKDESPESIGKILHELPNMKKKKLGEFLGKPKNVEILQVFINEFNWAPGLRIDEALREALTKFRLPGESQQIERVVKAFSTTYFEQCVAPIKNTESPSVEKGARDEELDIKSSDAAFVLSYAVVMLNTDQHNPQVLRRMKKEDFIKNVRGVNDEQNFKRSYLSDIYDAIQQNEMIIPEERADENFDVVLNEYIGEKMNIHSDADLISIDVELFNKYHRWLSLSILYINQVVTSKDDVVFNKNLTLFYELCNLAFCYGMRDVLQQLILSLLSQINLESGPKQRKNSLSNIKNPVVESFRNYKTQMLIVIFFKVLNEFGNLIHDSAVWNRVFDLIYQLFDANIITFDTFDFFYARTIRFPKIIPSDIPRVSSVAATTQAEGGIFSAISSFLMASSYTSPQVDSSVNKACIIDEEVVEYESNADEFIQNAIDDCKIDLLLTENVKHFDFTSIVSCLANPDLLDTDGLKSTVEIAHRSNTLLFRILMCAKLMKTTGICNRINVFLDFLVKISEEPSHNHFVVEKYSFYITLDLLKHIVVSNSTSAFLAAHDVILAMEKIGSNLLSAKFKVNYDRHGLHNIQFHDAISVYIFTALINTLPNFFESLSDNLKAVLSNCVKSLLLKMNGFNENPKLLKNTFEMMKLIYSYLEIPEQAEILLHFIRLYAFMFSNNLEDTKSASTIAQKLSSINSSVPSNASASPSSKHGDLFYDEYKNISVKCCTHLYNLLSKIKSSDVDTWDTHWLPILNGLGETVCHPCKETRQTAMLYLQKACIHAEIKNEHLERLFTQVLIPLLNSLNDASLMEQSLSTLSRLEEVKFRCSSLLSRLFLNYHHALTEEAISKIWPHILLIFKNFHDAATKLVKTNQRSNFDRKSSQDFTDHLSLVESIPETIKNMILVTSTSDTFTDEMWENTWKILDSWLPHIRKEIFPDHDTNQDHDKNQPSIELSTSPVESVNDEE